MVVLPIALDQPFNAGVVQNKGLGLKMQLSSFTVDELADNIETVVQSEQALQQTLKLHILPSCATSHKVQQNAYHSGWIMLPNMVVATYELVQWNFQQFSSSCIYAFVFVTLLGLLFVVVCCMFRQHGNV